MLSDESKRVADKAKTLYDQKYRESLEKDHHSEFVCIEPESGDYFLGATFDEAGRLYTVSDDGLIRKFVRDGRSFKQQMMVPSKSGSQPYSITIHPKPTRTRAR